MLLQDAFIWPHKISYFGWLILETDPRKGLFVRGTIEQSGRSVQQGEVIYKICKDGFSNYVPASFVWGF